MNTQPNVIDAVVNEVGKVVVGYESVAEKLVYAALSDGHVLLESVPGLAKTLLIKTMQRSIRGATQSRIQMTPNIMPLDITGVSIFDQKTGDFRIKKGPIFCNLFLADELNRATPKAQSALLEAMAEKRVTIDGQTFDLPNPFLACATINPVEQEGTYPLPEAQLDRFVMKVRMDYVSKDSEVDMLNRTHLRTRDPMQEVKEVVAVEELASLRDHIREHIFTAPALQDYIVRLCRSTRPGSEEFKEAVAGCQERGVDLGAALELGTSPRAMQAMLSLSQVRAYHKGRDFALPEDVRYIAADVLRHRMMLTRKARMSRVTPEAIIEALLLTVKWVESTDDYRPKNR